MKKNRKFSNFLINPKYQLKYIFWLSATGLSLVALYSVIFYTYIRENYEILVELSPMDDTSKQQLYRELTHVILLLGGISFIFIVLVSIAGVIVSHRTAGPLYHFKRVFNEIKSGKKDARVRLRPNDDFQDVAASFNEMIESVLKN